MDAHSGAAPPAAVAPCTRPACSVCSVCLAGLLPCTIPLRPVLYSRPSATPARLQRSAADWASRVPFRCHAVWQGHGRAKTWSRPTTKEREHSIVCSEDCNAFRQYFRRLNTHRGTWGAWAQGRHDWTASPAAKASRQASEWSARGVQHRQSAVHGRRGRRDCLPFTRRATAPRYHARRSFGNALHFLAPTYMTFERYLRSATVHHAKIRVHERKRGGKKEDNLRAFFVQKNLK